jgi:hypothetical protein
MTTQQKIDSLKAFTVPPHVSAKTFDPRFGDPVAVHRLFPKCFATLWRGGATSQRRSSSRNWSLR